VGIAGYGVVGKRRRAFIDQHPWMTTVAVCDQTFGRPCVASDGIRCYPSYHGLLEDSLDVLFVSLPNYLAADVTIAGLERGLHVFCEKPPGRDLSDVERVIQVEQEHPGLVLKYGFNHRYHHSVKDALKLVQSAELGDIINLRGIYGKSKMVSFASGWRAERKYAGGGILLDQGIHLVDLMQLFCGSFVEVKSFISNRFWRHDVEDNAFALMRDADGRVAMLHSSATQWQHRFSLEIALEKGFLELRGILSGSKSYGEERLVIGRRDESDTGATREETVTYLVDDSWRDEIHEFADVIMGQAQVQSGTSAQALATMRLVYQIYAADPEWKLAYDIVGPEPETVQSKHT
jgi:predicted dehydrogenase